MRSRRGDGFSYAAPGEADHIHITFDEDSVLELADRFARAVEVIEDEALAIELGFRGVQVLGLIVFAERAAAISDHFGLFVLNGEHEAAPEAIVESAVAFALSDEPCLQELLGCESFPLQLARESLAVAIRQAEAELFGDRGRDAAPL